MDALNDLLGTITAADVLSVVAAVVILVVGWAAARVATATLQKAVATRMSAQHAMLLVRGVYYGLVALVLAVSLSELGVDLSVLLGAAGVLTVAAGFAAQTSVSNLISGLFLLVERPFVVGDVIQVGGTTGEVVAIDLISVKLRTFDNLLVRFPNETLLKAEIRNITHFPVRRFDLQLTLSHDTSIPDVRSVLTAVADEHPLALDEPRPSVLFLGFTDNGTQLQFSVWAATPRFADLRNSLPERVKAAFDAAGIRLPYPHRVVHVVNPPSQEA